VAVSLDGARLATSNRYGTVRLWDAPSRQERTTLTGHTGPVQAPDGALFATGSGDQTVRLWSIT
jgi:WD40 repeat protein